MRRNSSRYRSLVDNAPEAITVIDPDTKHFVEANEPALRLFKMTREQLLAVDLDTDPIALKLALTTYLLSLAVFPPERPLRIARRLRQRRIGARRDCAQQPERRDHG